MAERSTVEGAVQSLIFQNEDNGYTVLSLLTDDGELVTVVGCIPCAAPGERMTVTGVWTNHPSYGPQFAAESVERRMPETEEDIAAYLASGILKGIGPATAQRLVDRFGADTLAVIEEEPERLQTVKGITAKKAMELSAAFRELTGLKRVMEFLARYELPVPLAMQLYRAYGADALPRLREDPYLLTGDAYGVAFSTMDEIALSMGFDGDSPCRVEAALTYELSHNLNNGHVFLPRDKLLFASAQLIDGDPDQLPSVGPGNVLGDILRSGAVDSVTLTEVFRQAEQSAIIRSAHAVNRGQAPDLSNKQSDFFFLCRRSPDRLVQTVVDLCRTRLPDKMGIPAGQIQVLTPTRKGETGTVSLNRALQAALNPPAPGKRQKAWGDMIFRVGDRVMQTRNNYDVLWEKDDGEAGSGIFNGDVGTVEDIDPSGELVTIRFDDRTSVYTADLLSQLDMAYAMTVHKAQGSEYRAVVLVSAPAAPNLLVRGVLYTAITRARELLVMVGDDAIPGRMAENDRRTRRYSGLRRRLKQGGPSHGHE